MLAPRERTKLSAQSVECVFLGYSPEHKGYCCYDPSRRIRISRDVTFFENRPFFYNPSTQPSYSSTESTSFMCLPPISITPPIPPPAHAPPTPPPSPSYVPPTPPPHAHAPPSPPPPPYPFSKPPITCVFSHRPKTSTELPSSSTTSDSPDAPVVDDSNNIDESHIVSDETQAGPRYNL